MAWTPGWGFRKKITVQNSQVTANQTDFPTLVNLASDSDIAANARSDGFDIFFTRADGTTECNYERVHYNNSTGQLVAHFLANSLSSSTDTDFYVYFGNSGQTSDKQNATGTWPSSFKGVWHLSESSGTRSDSTSNNNDLSDNNTVGSATGKIYQGADFERSNSEYLSITDASQTGLDITGDISLSAWVSVETLPSSPSAGYGLISKGTGGVGGDLAYTSFINVTDKVQVQYSQDGGGTNRTRQESDNVDYSSGEEGDFKHIVIVADVSTASADIYNNGTEVASTTDQSGATSIYNSSNDFEIGSWSNVSYYHDGVIEEARVYSGLYPTGWIATEYNNQNSPGTFYTLGSLESNPDAGQSILTLGVS